jgi:hypothetical protein
MAYLEHVGMSTLQHTFLAGFADQISLSGIYHVSRPFLTSAELNQLVAGKDIECPPCCTWLLRGSFTIRIEARRVWRYWLPAEAVRVLGSRSPVTRDLDFCWIGRCSCWTGGAPCLRAGATPGFITLFDGHGEVNTVTPQGCNVVQLI